MIGKFFEKLKSGLSKTKDNLTNKVVDALSSAVTIDEDLYEELEEILITADIGVDTSIFIIEKLRNKVREKRIKDPLQINNCLKEVIVEIFGEEENSIDPETTPEVLFIIGVNGAGKTTSIGKISAKLKRKDYKVLLAAADTFRAAAIDQLQVWADRANVDLIKHSEGADPGAVVFDAIQSAKARKADILICDTAGRLHNKKNLMNELGKINRIIEREYSEANKKTYLVLDGTTGQNALMQAKQFKEVCLIDGIILTKLDGTAKGGVVIAIKHLLDIPVKMIGVGESIDDLQEFSAKDFVEALF
ncbi:signal recognition particle-docking protein FtsY [Clostridium sediminicola]|uniref:signal recognition particle-docking protein FtsY n=1 Tax=Clostridium sediminicola TaxID=3114879 RepID=UPI003D168828